MFILKKKKKKKKKNILASWLISQLNPELSKQSFLFEPAINGFVSIFFFSFSNLSFWDQLSINYYNKINNIIINYYKNN